MTRIFLRPSPQKAPPPSPPLPDFPSTPSERSFDFQISGDSPDDPVEYEDFGEALKIIKQADPNFLPSINPEESNRSIVMKAFEVALIGGRLLHQYSEPLGSPAPSVRFHP